jgi:hypothetical protein
MTIESADTWTSMSDPTNVTNLVVRKRQASARILTICGINERATIAVKSPGIPVFVHIRDVIATLTSLSRELKTCESICGVCIN